MSDERLRELERIFRQTGSDEDHVVWLRERLRRGNLETSLVETAARCGHALATAALGGPEAASLEEFPALLESLAPRLLLDALLGVSRRALERLPPETHRLAAATLEGISQCLAGKGGREEVEVLGNRSGSVPWAYDCAKASFSWDTGAMDAYQEWGKLALLNLRTALGEMELRRLLSLQVESRVTFDQHE